MLTKTIAKPTKSKTLLSPGHRACAGCGQLIAARTVAEALGPNTIIANATGCLEVTTTPYPESAWGMPWIHSLFENASAVASGIRAALDYKEKNKSPLPPFVKGGIKVVAQGGDGGTFDIGFGLISGMWERGENILYVCYDNEAYMNTGIQASGATPWAAHTTTTPAGSHSIGSQQRKKDMIAIALAHGLPYVAQTTAGFLADITAKVKKAAAIEGPAYIQILSPCVPGWGVDPAQTIKLGKLAAQTGLYPLLEYTNGQLTNVMKVPSPQPK
ncbi:pyruvate ferredoxin oxidoreductase, partial [Patescibacteria group bacterium]|nr:pyruvate ferredoxin oxidoreductase [Patescibacteria group bacterium]